MPEPAEKPRIRVELPAPDARSGRAVDGVALIPIDRPEVLNALDYRTLREVVEALATLDADESCRCVVITAAGARAFAASAYIRGMAYSTPVSRGAASSFARWEQIRRMRVPIGAAVRGYALGGGC